ncbi:MAG: hypothetical protein Q9206_005508 [Seirophora lacunosa]
MPTYTGHCHCGQIEWTVKIDEPAHVLCHCDACKLLSGGESTLNTIVPASDFSITKGELKTYSYQGDSGIFFPSSPTLFLSFPFPSHLPILPPKGSKIAIDQTGNPVHCYYCPVCTSSPYHHQTVLGDKYVVRTGLLQGGKDFGVGLEIFGKDRAKWAPQVAETLPGPPGA